MNRTKILIILSIVILSTSNGFAQKEDVISNYVYSWYKSNLKYLDIAKERHCNDSTHLKSIYSVQSLVTKASFRRKSGVSERELIVNSLKGQLMNLNLNNLLIIETFTMFHTIKYYVTIIDNSGAIFKLEKNKEDWVLTSTNEVERQNEYMERFNKTKPIEDCESGYLSNSYSILTLVKENSFSTKIACSN